MVLDFAQLDSSADGSDFLRARICIVGGGIAGLILANELVRSGHDVLLLEAGGFRHDAHMAPNEVIQAGHPHPGTIESRINAFGGTSLVWGGQLLPLPSDAKWPVTAGELASFVPTAERLLGVDELPYDGNQFFKALDQAQPDFLAQLADLTLAFSKFAPFSRRNLAQTIGRELRRQPGFRLAVHAQAVNLLSSAKGDRIEAVTVRSISGRMFRVEAMHFVLAAGTIETVRLLLASPSSAAQGFGNAYDQVGRNFHDHLTVTAATLHGQARQQLLAHRPRIHRGTLHALKLFAGEELRRRLDLNSVLAHLTIEEPPDGGIEAVRKTLRARQQVGTAAAIRDALPDVLPTVRDGTLLAVSTAIQRRRYVSAKARVQLQLNVAQRWPSASRITLADDGRAVVRWEIDESELATLRRFANHLRGHLRLDGIDWEPSLVDSASPMPALLIDDARHAMGGACMGTDPRNSVVDSDLRVHGVHNLSIASCAVFPDGSPQLPTLTLMALTLRLAARLHRHS